MGDGVPDVETTAGGRTLVPEGIVSKLNREPAVVPEGTMTFASRGPGARLPDYLLPPDGMTRWHVVTLMANRIDPVGMSIEDVRDVCEALVRTGRAVPAGEASEVPGGGGRHA